MQFSSVFCGLLLIVTEYLLASNARESRDTEHPAFRGCLSRLRDHTLLLPRPIRIEGKPEVATTRRLPPKPGQRRRPLAESILSRHLATVDEKITGEAHSRDGNRSERKEGRKEETRRKRTRERGARDTVVLHADTP